MTTPIRFSLGEAKDAQARLDDGEGREGDKALAELLEGYNQQQQHQRYDAERRAEYAAWLAHECGGCTEGGAGELCEEHWLDDVELSSQERDALASIAQGDPRPELQGHGDAAVAPPAPVQALADRGLVTYTPNLGWRLTYPVGFATAEELELIERPDPTEGSPGDPHDPQAEAGCVTCGASEAKWPVDHPLYQPGGSQCPRCIQADISEDQRHVRSADV